MTACARLNYPKRNLWGKEDVELVRCASRITAIGASGNYSLTPLVGAKIAVTEAKSASVFEGVVIHTNLA
jgi:hypothetical protein